VCDGHDLPFEDATFDAVVCQAVLEHVLDPPRVVAEMHRVLRPGGLLYAEIPFMQQVHEGAYDLTRYTYVGQRRLFRRFDELASGPVCGPAMALAWSVRYLAVTLAGSSARARAVISHLVPLTTFWLPRLDRWLIGRPGAMDAASSIGFLGRWREDPLGDDEIVASYRGLNATPSRW
jgi:SAM-dependent methyltransferase